MMLLAKLSPAESLLILDGKRASLKSMLKFTFMDLLLKRVLETSEGKPIIIARYKGSINKYVVIGKNFYTYLPKSHEGIFLAPFYKGADLKILFRHVVKMGYENAGSKKRFHSLVSKNPGLENLFSKNFFQKIVGGFSLNDNGIQTRRQLDAEIRKIENELRESLQNDKLKALDTIKKIGGNIFLLTNIDFSSIQLIDQALFKEMSKDQKTLVGDSGCGSDGYGWSHFESDASSFDSSCSGDSGGSSSSSGCGGSGCGSSGCGGCGGGGD